MGGRKSWKNASPANQPWGITVLEAGTRGAWEPGWGPEAGAPRVRQKMSDYAQSVDDELCIWRKKKGG